MSVNDEVDAIEQAWRRERPDLDASSIAINTRIWRIARLLDRQRERVLRDVGSDGATLDLLATLRRAGAPYELTPHEVAARTLVTSGGVSQRLAKAERAGLVRRRPSPDDGRSVIVGLTGSGLDMVDRIVEHLFEVEGRSLASLGSTRHAAVVAVLRDVLDELEARVER